MKRSTISPLTVVNFAVVGLVLLPLLGLLTTLGSHNFHEATQSRRGIADLILNTIYLSVAVTLGAVTIGTWLAWVEHRAQFLGRKVLTLLSLLPMATPSYLLAATAAQAMGGGGWIGPILGMKGLHGLPAAILVLTVVTTPYVQLVVGASLSRQSAAEEEAARLLGASAWRIFKIQTLPAILPAMAYSGAIVLLYAISDFGAVAVLDSPVLTWRLYQAAEGHDLARAAILGATLIGLTVPVFIGARWMNKLGQNHTTVANPRPISRRHLTRPTTLMTYGLLFSIVGIGVIVPAATLIHWFWQGLAAGREILMPWTHLAHTIGAALLGAFITLLLALAPAWANARQKSRVNDVLEQGIYLTGALPGVLIAFGLMLAALFAARITPDSRGLYATMLGSGFLLFLGYGLRFIPELYTPLKTTIAQLDKRQEESARVLGVSRTKWFSKIAFPALAPGASVAFLLGFLAVIKELPLTLLLGGSTGLQTLAFRVWDRYAEALWHDAAAAGGLLMILALAGVALTLPWRRHV